MGYDDIKIRDLSRILGEWTPPIGALGGPPAHELYRDLLLFAELRLFKDTESRPWVLLRDGAHRRAFLVPSIELRNALDRFRMRRNLRPLPEGDIEEFGRIIEARVTDPDAEIPVLVPSVVERLTVPARTPLPAPPAEQAVPSVPAVPGPIPVQTRGSGSLLATPSPADAAEVPPPSPARTVARGPLSAGSEDSVNPSISGAHALSTEGYAEVERYVRTLRRLVRDGDWMGTTRELSDALRDDPVTMFTSFLRYRSELAENDLLVTNVEVDGNCKWLAVDRGKVQAAAPTRPPVRRMLLAE